MYFYMIGNLPIGQRNIKVSIWIKPASGKPWGSPSVFLCCLGRPRRNETSVALFQLLQGNFSSACQTDCWLTMVVSTARARTCSTGWKVWPCRQVARVTDLSMSRVNIRVSWLCSFGKSRPFCRFQASCSQSDSSSSKSSSCFLERPKNSTCTSQEQ